MRFKGTTVLLILFVILGGYVYFSEYRGKEQRDKQEEAKKKAFNIDEKDIVGLELIYPDRTLSATKKGDKQWDLANPTGTGMQADSDEWGQLASDFTRVERNSTVTSQPGDLTTYGLKNPAVKVVVKTKDGKSHEISFGSENPSKLDDYATIGGSSDVFLTPSSWGRMFQKTLSDVRDKKVLNFEPDDIDAVTIANGSSEIVAHKSGNDWSIQKPIDTKADTGEFTGFTSSLNFARATGFAESSVDAKSAGLEPPAIKITLHDTKAKTDHVLLIGKSPEADKYYAMDQSRPTIFIIDKEIDEKAKRPLFDWRDKSIAQVDREKVDEIEIQHGSDKFSFKKSDADWKLPDGRKLQWDKVSAMLNTLEFDKAKDIIDTPGALTKYGLDKPRIEVVFRQGTTELIGLSFGSDSKSPEGVYVKASTDPAIKVVLTEVYDRFNVKPEDLVEAKPADSKPAGK